MRKRLKKRQLSELSSLDDFLNEEGVNERVTLRAVKRVVALQLQKAMKRRHLSKSAMARLMATSRAQIDRVLDPAENNITLETLSRAARIVGRSLRVELH